MSKTYYVYIASNEKNTVLYTGVTGDLLKRVHEHKEKLADGFAKRYNVTKLVYYEIFSDARSAIEREKQIKAGPRHRKVKLITETNRTWRDLYDELQG